MGHQMRVGPSKIAIFCFLRSLYLSKVHIWDQNYYVWVCSPPMAFHRHQNRWPWIAATRFRYGGKTVAYLMIILLQIFRCAYQLTEFEHISPIFGEAFGVFVYSSVYDFSRFMNYHPTWQQMILNGPSVVHISFCNYNTIHYSEVNAWLCYAWSRLFWRCYWWEKVMDAVGRVTHFIVKTSGWTIK